MATYYVSNAGSDAAAGTSTGTAWQTIAKVNGVTFVAGDTILFNKGDTWRETLTVPASNLTFGAYGSGADPIINAADVVSLTWTAETTASHEDFTDGSGPRPMAWWGFAETSGSRADTSTNANTLSETGGTISRVTGPNANVPYGAAFSQGSSQRLARTNTNLNAGFPGKTGVADGDMSFGCWLKPSGNAADAGVMGKGQCYGIGVDGPNDQLYAYVSDDSYSPHSVYAGGSTAPLSTWIHAVAVWVQSSGLLTLYRNGSSVGTATSATLVQDTFDMDIGRAFTYNATFDGSVAEPFVFASALTSTQVADIYAAGLGGSVGGTTGKWSAPAESGKVYARRFVVNDTACALCTAKTDLDTGTYKSYWDGANHWLYLNGVLDPNAQTIQANHQGRMRGVSASGVDAITITDLDVRYAYNTNIGVDGTAGPIEIARCTALSAGSTSSYAGDGILVYGGNYGGTPSLATGVSIHDNVSSGNLNNAIEVWALDGASIADNTGSGNGGAIEVWGFVTDSTFSGNVITENLGASISTASQNAGRGLWGSGAAQEAPNTGSQSDNTVTRNVFANGAGHGIRLDAGTGWLVYHNTVSGHTTGISISTSGTTATLKNNITADNSTEVNAGTGTTVTSDYNDFFHTAGGTFLTWHGVAYNFANWKTNSSQDAHSISSDPLFTDAGADDFTLTLSSPCINTGVAIAGINDGYSGAAPDIGAFEYSPGALVYPFYAYSLFSHVFAFFSMAPGESPPGETTGGGVIFPHSRARRIVAVLNGE